MDNLSRLEQGVCSVIVAGFGHRTVLDVLT